MYAFRRTSIFGLILVTASLTRANIRVIELHRKRMKSKISGCCTRIDVIDVLDARSSCMKCRPSSSSPRMAWASGSMARCAAFRSNPAAFAAPAQLSQKQVPVTTSNTRSIGFDRVAPLRDPVAKGRRQVWTKSTS